MALVVEDEVGVEVKWSDRGTPVPRVAVVSVLHVLLGLMNRCFVAPSVRANVIMAVSIGLLLVVLIKPGVRVVGDDENLALIECR